MFKRQIEVVNVPRQRLLENFAAISRIARLVIDYRADAVNEEVIA